MYAEYHLYEALLGNIAEAEGNVYLARRLQTNAKLRLINMSDEELWRLAAITSYPSGQSIIETYLRYRRGIEELKITSGEWMKDLEHISITDGSGVK